MYTLRVFSRLDTGDAEALNNRAFYVCLFDDKVSIETVRRGMIDDVEQMVE
jgi:hypothetical protein